MPLHDEMLTDALDAQKFTRKFFVVELDFSAKSVRDLEAQFDAIRYALRGGATPENRAKLRRLWGAYLGEVLVRLGRGEWVEEESAQGRRIGVRIEAQVHYPHERVEERIDKGAESGIVEWVNRILPTRPVTQSGTE